MKPPKSIFGRIADRFRAAFRSTAGRMTHQGYGGQGYGWRLLLPGAQYDYEAAAGDLWRNSTVAACLGWLARNFAEPKLEAVRTKRDGSKEIVPSDCVRLLNKPNKFYGKYQLAAAMVLSAKVDGNVYLRKIRSAAGVPVELWWIPHWLIWPRWNPDGSEFVGWYEYSVNGKIERIAVEDIVHIRIGIDPRDDRKGFSEVKQTVRSVCGLNECDTYTASLLRNMGIPGVIISPGHPDVNMSRDDIDVFKDQWRENYTSEGRGDPLVGSRMFKVEKIALTPEELTLDKIPARMEDQVCAAIGISPMVVNLTAGAQHKTYANYGEARKAAYEDCLIPLQKMMAEELTIQLLADFPGTADELRWDYAGVQCLQESTDAVADRIGDLYAKHRVIKRSEAREALGYDWTEEDEVYATAPAPKGAGPDDEPDQKPDPSEEEKRMLVRIGRVLEKVEQEFEAA